MSNLNKIYKMKKFRKQFNNEKVLYDRLFQRKYGAWSLPKKRKLILTLNKGWALTNIVVADIEACIEHAKYLKRDEERQNLASKCEESIERFTSLRQGTSFKYTSLDGQHRTKTLLEFFENKFTVSGNFLDGDDNEVVVKNQYFKDLPPRLRDRLNDATISVSVVDDALYSELAPIFVSLQEGEPLKPQEKRQAKHTPVANWIKDLAKDMSEAMGRFHSDVGMTRAEDDETVAKMTMELIRRYKDPEIPTDWGFSSKDIDEWYDIGEGYNSFEDSSCNYIGYTFSRAKEILNSFSAAVRTQQINKSRSIGDRKQIIWPLLTACEYMQDEEMYTTDMSKLFETVASIHKELYKASELKYNKDKVEAAEADPNNSLKKSHYYWHNSTVPHQKTSRAYNRQVFLAKFTESANIQSSLLRKKAAAIAAK